MHRTGASRVGPLADRMLDIGCPVLDWVKLAEGLGVQAIRTETADEFITAFLRAMREPGPRLIEAVLNEGRSQAQ